MVWIVAALWCYLASALAQQELPTDRLLRSLQPTADVNDFAGVLTPAEKEALEARCRQLREATGAQLAVVTLQSLEGGQIDDFAVKLFQQWGIGNKDRKNGVLLLVAIADRKARIEVGYGLEPILPDALAGRILGEQLFPAFKQQRYADGLQAAVARIAEIVEKNEPAPKNSGGTKQGDLFTTVVMLTLVLACASFAFGAGLAKGNKQWIPISLFVVALTLLGGVCIAFPWAPFLQVPIGLVLGWLGWLAGKNDFRGPRGRSPSVWDFAGPSVNTWDWGGSSGWSGGGFSGGSSSWGGFGGGSSGGGGASGGW